jgi:hypothetical protein
MFVKPGANLVFFAENLTAILIAVLTLFVGLNGVLFDIRKNTETKNSFKNISRLGWSFILIIFILGGVTFQQEITEKHQSAEEKLILNEKLKFVRAELLKAQERQIKLTKITTGIGEVSIQTNSLATETNGLANNIEDITIETKVVTEDNQTLLGSMNSRSANSVVQQSEIIRNLEGLKFELVNQRQLIDEILKKNNIKASEVSIFRYAHVTFDKISVIENCEKTTSNDGDFYYDLYANGQPLTNPRHSLSSPLRLADNSESQEENLGKINNIKILKEDDTILFSGYVRERDQRNILFRWTYKYDGVFSKSIAISKAKDEIQVINYPDCDVTLHFSIRVTDKAI